jgi:hypothetical protein
MQSPHEFATLLLVKDAPDQVDLNRTDERSSRTSSSGCNESRPDTSVPK